MAVVLLGGLGCKRPGGDARQARVESVGDIIAAVPDSEMRERWRQAEARGQLPPLESLPVPARPLSERAPAVTREEPVDPRPPVIAQGTVATMRAFSREPIAQYRGPFVATDVGASRIVGRLAGRQAPLELHYRLPNGQALAVRASDSLDLTLREDVVDGSMRQLVHLRAARDPALLLYVSDGGRAPYARRFEDIPLVVTQERAGRDNVAAVSVTYAGQSLRLVPGDRRQLRDANGTVEIFLLSSYFTPPDRLALAEGDPYHVTLFMYRVGGA